MLNALSPFTLVLFGASGHLAQLKIYPSLYTLALKKRLPDDYRIVGFARSEMDHAGFRKLVEDAIRRDMESVNEEVLYQFLQKFTYHQGQYADVKDFASLAVKIDEWENMWPSSVRLTYLSIPPDVFAPTLHNICEGNIHKPGQPFRVIVEKPVGQDTETYNVVRKQLMSCFDESEVYLLDHYLGKEAVRNVYYMRYANPILEWLFKNTLIRTVEITAAESAGIGGRAGYFEPSGTFRDMFQSHLLMIGSLLTMRVRDDDQFLPESRLEALRQFYLPPATRMEEIALQAQYAEGDVRGDKAVGYRSEEGVHPQSRQNTYAALALLTRESQWQGVPFFLRSGKRLQKKETRISVMFHEPRKIEKGSGPNRLDIILQGEAGMRLHLQTKMGGSEPQFRPLVMEDPLVCYGDCLPEHSILILEAIHGRKQWFLSFEEVQTSWKLIDPVQSYFMQPETPLYFYPAGSHGPVESDQWIQKHGVTWM
jgi:glucose-6-phosphate 1-dehydrogenase